MSDGIEGQEEKMEKMLKELLYSYKTENVYTLRELFERRLQELDITKNQATEILQVEIRTLNGIIDGTLKRLDFTVIPRIADFLKVTPLEFVQKYMMLLEKKPTEDLGKAEKNNFIVNNFDLANLKKGKVISSITDFEKIERELMDFFGYDTIFDYRKDTLRAAFSSGAQQSKNEMMREFWVERAYLQLKRINNFYEYDRNGLIQFFPYIRSHSIRENDGLFQVVRLLFKLGVTVIYQPFLPTIYARGATFAVNGKPCIVLTDYKGFYATLWFTLLHELHHILFDWEQIKANSYHISEEYHLFSLNEEKADEFAREYLFSSKKMDEVAPHINDEYFIQEYADQSQVHPSIIYAIYCFEEGKNEPNVWGRYRRLMPSADKAIKSLGGNPWQKPIKESVAYLKETIFNI